MNEIVEIVLPLPPNRANARWHWRTEQRKKSDYFYRCQASPNPQPPVYAFKKVIVSATLYVWGTMDTDNLFARLKWPMDYLVGRGFIQDDKPKVVEWDGIPSQEIDRKHQRIEITLEPVDDA